MSQPTEEELWNCAFTFHGHRCPAMPIGFRLTRELMRRLGVERAKDSQIYAFVEIGEDHFAGCFADGVMVASGCTLGKSNIKRLGYGKFAVTIYDPKQKKGIRGCFRTEAMQKNMQSPFFTEYRSRGVPASQVPPEVGEPLIKRALEAPIEMICKIEEVREMDIDLPKHCFAASPCEKCGEMVVDTYAQEKDGKRLCIPCASEE